MRFQGQKSVEGYSMVSEMCETYDAEAADRHLYPQQSHLGPLDQADLILLELGLCSRRSRRVGEIDNDPHRNRLDFALNMTRPCTQDRAWPLA